MRVDGLLGGVAAIWLQICGAIARKGCHHDIVE